MELCLHRWDVFFGIDTTMVLPVGTPLSSFQHEETDFHWSLVLFSCLCTGSRQPQIQLSLQQIYLSENSCFGFASVLINVNYFTTLYY